MSIFYVTFGKRGLRDGYVRLRAVDEQQAREFCRDEYGPVWSGLYHEGDHDPSYYPAGQIGEVFVS